MNDNHIQKIKETASLILDAGQEDLKTINTTLNYILDEFSKIGYKDYFLNLLKTSFDNLKRAYIAGVLLESNYLAKVNNLKFATQQYVESTTQFVVIEFAKDYALAQQYAQQSLDKEKIISIRSELLKAKELSYSLLKKDIEGETKFLEEALINVDKVIHGKRIIDKDYLNLKHRYINLRTDLINGIIVDLSDFYKALSQIKKAAELYFEDVDNFSNTSLNEEVLAKSQPQNHRESLNDSQTKNPLAPFPDNDIYNEYIKTLNLINMKSSMGNELDDRLLKTYILLTKEVKNRKIAIKDSDNLLFRKVSALLPLDLG